jgi:intracellular multiplication protein IcmX
MKLVSKVVLINLFFLIALPAGADDISSKYSNQQANSNIEKLVKNLTNMGEYFGYDISKSAKDTANNKQISQELLSKSTTQLIENYIYNAFWGAMPVTSTSKDLKQFVPDTAYGAKTLNPQANMTFSDQEYSTASGGDNGKISASKLIDQSNQQKEYQQDPVSQAVLNILGTPDVTYCMAFDLTAMNDDCKLLYQNLVMTNVIGTIPDPNTFFDPAYNQKILGQLNSNTLIGPLLYSTENKNESSVSRGSSPFTPQNPKSTGLTAQSQAQAAANFIRYASGAVTPNTLPKLQAYTTLYTQAVPSKPNTLTPEQKMQQVQAQTTLSNYLANLRVFAAQSSVGIGNLYYILSKRLPQKLGNSSDTITSEAMSEFKMASWRLFNPDKSENKQWIAEINNASSATVQKEMATLLAEINYQMYLNRQLQERLLLTNSIMLLQNTKSAQPSADFANQVGAPQ